MKYKLFLALVLVLLVLPASKLRPGEFLIEGNSALSEGTLRKVAGDSGCRGNSSCLDSLCHRIAEYYWNQGYLDATTRCEKTQDSLIRIEVFEGDQYIIDSIKLKGMAAEDSLLAYEHIDELIGKPFNGFKMKQCLTWLLNFYDQRGYPLVSITPKLIADQGNRIGLHLLVNEGPSAKVREVVFDGLKNTHKEILLQETGLREGDRFNGKLLGDVRNRLLKLGIFRQVGEPHLVYDSMDTTVTIEVGVTEAASTDFSGYASYAPSSDSHLIGSIDLRFRNLGGTLRRFHLNWNRPGYERLKWMVEYTEPRILSKPLSATLEAESDVSDTVYAHRKFRFSLDWRKSANLGIGLGVILGSNKDRSLRNAEGDFNEKGLTFSLGYNGESDELNPRSGSVLKISHESLILTYAEGSPHSNHLASLQVLGTNATGLWGDWVLFSKICFEGVFASKVAIPASYLIRIGGMGSLRGYTEEALVAERAITLTIEPRLVLSPNSRIYGFVDAAMIGSSSQPLTFRSTSLGYGLGIMALARVAIVRLDIGLAQNEAWTNARLHFAVIRRF